MRLLHVVATGQRRGAEMFASDLVRALRSLGDFQQEVAILRGPWPSDVAYDAPVRRLRANGRHLPGLRMDLTTLSSLRRTLARFRPQIVHAHGGEAFKYLALGAGRGPRLVYRRIGLAHRSGTHGLARAGHAALLRRSDLVVAVAEAVRRETIDTFGLPEDRVVTIPRGVDPLRLRAERDRSAVREELGIAASAPVVISVGALSPEKDPIALLDLCASLTRSMPDVTHLFAGDGPMREELTQAVRARGLEGHVRLLGSRADIGDLLGASDLLVLASRSEGMPGCLIEAGMAALPVVAFRVAGVPEVLADGVTGYLVEAGDHDGLARRTIELLGDEQLRRSMGAAAEERCRSLFAIEHVAGRYADVYAEVARS